MAFFKKIFLDLELFLSWSLSPFWVLIQLPIHDCMSFKSVECPTDSGQQFSVVFALGTKW